MSIRGKSLFLTGLVLAFILIPFIAGSAAASAPEANSPHTLLHEQLWTLALWIMAGTFLILVILGLTDRVVIFYNGADAFWSLFPFLSIVLSVIIATTIGPDETKLSQHAQTQLPVFVVWAGSGGALLGGVMTIYNSVRYNSNALLGVIVGICKIIISVLMALLTVIYLINSFFPDNRRTFGQQLTAMMFLGWTMWLWKKLVNGERVNERRRAIAQS